MVFSRLMLSWKLLLFTICLFKPSSCADLRLEKSVVTKVKWKTEVKGLASRRRTKLWVGGLHLITCGKITIQSYPQSQSIPRWKTNLSEVRKLKWIFAIERAERSKNLYHGLSHWECRKDFRTHNSSRLTNIKLKILFLRSGPKCLPNIMYRGLSHRKGRTNTNQIFKDVINQSVECRWCPLR